MTRQNYLLNILYILMLLCILNYEYVHCFRNVRSKGNGVEKKLLPDAQNNGSFAEFSLLNPLLLLSYHNRLDETLKQLYSVEKTFKNNENIKDTVIDTVEHVKKIVSEVNETITELAADNEVQIKTDDAQKLINGVIQNNKTQNQIKQEVIKATQKEEQEIVEKAKNVIDHKLEKAKNEIDIQKVRAETELGQAELNATEELFSLAKNIEKTFLNKNGTTSSAKGYALALGVVDFASMLVIAIFLL